MLKFKIYMKNYLETQLNLVFHFKLNLSCSKKKTLQKNYSAFNFKNLLGPIKNRDKNHSSLVFKYLKGYFMLYEI